MSLYSHVVARCYDRWYEPAERAGLADMRRDLLAGARGRVLEVGAGTGLNVPLYGRDVDELVLVEPQEPMLERLRARLRGRSRAPRLVRARAESLPFADGAFDVAVCTFALCTVQDLERSLAEIRRVLRPGGGLAFLEHVQAREPRLARWQDRMHDVWLKVGDGCHLNRRTLEAIAAGGFEVQSVERGDLPKALALFRPYVRGWAAAP